MASGQGIKVMSTLPEHLKAMGQRYPVPVLATGAGSRLIAADYWNHGLRKNMPHHFKVQQRIPQKMPFESTHKVHILFSPGILPTVASRS